MCGITGYIGDKAALPILMDSLKNAKGNINKAAKLIGITVRKFSYKAERYGISYKDYR